LGSTHVAADRILPREDGVKFVTDALAQADIVRRAA
jgi:hypothetical protein